MELVIERGVPVEFKRLQNIDAGNSLSAFDAGKSYPLRINTRFNTAPFLGMAGVLDEKVPPPVQPLWSREGLSRCGSGTLEYGSVIRWSRVVGVGLMLSKKPDTSPWASTSATPTVGGGGAGITWIQTAAAEIH